MAAEKYRKRYFLFTEPVHERLRFDYPHGTDKEFIRLWNEGHGYEKICSKLRLDEDEFALIVISLKRAGHIKYRKHGIFGKGA